MAIAEAPTSDDIGAFPIRKFGVVTRVPDPNEPGGSGNLALNLSIYFQVDNGDQSTGYLPRVEPITKVMGQASIMARTPVFRLGEILLIGFDDRDVLTGQAPGKWDVDVEYFDGFTAALRRALDVVRPDDQPGA